MLNILVTNDDGIEARGIAALVLALGKLADVYVVAPAEQQSGKSMSITFMRPVSVLACSLDGAVEAFSLDGTPADCIKWGLRHLEEDGITPDYVVSGINMGYNLGAATHYSGTFSAAKEAALSGVRSLALSVGSHEATHFDYMTGLIPRLLEMSAALEPSVILNVNVPDIPSWAVKGLKAVPAAPYGYAECFLFEDLEDGNYQMRPFPGRRDELQLYDYDWTAKDYATVSPVPAFASDRAALMKLNGLCVPSDCLTVIIGAQTGTPDMVKKGKRFRRNIEKLAHAISRMGKPIILAEACGKGETLPEIVPYAGESETVRHIHPDAWTSPDMEKFVAAADCRKAIIAGAPVNTEVLQTAAGFIDKGYEVMILEDCCAASDKASKDLALDALKELGCRISTLETEVMKLAGDCDRPILESVKAILQ